MAAAMAAAMAAGGSALSGAGPFGDAALQLCRVLGLRPDVMAAADATQMRPREATCLILATAVAWLALEGVLGVALHPALTRLFARARLSSSSSNGSSSSASVRPSSEVRVAAARDATSAVVNLVSIVHVVIQVPIALAVLLDPAVNSDTIYGYTRLSVAMCVVSAGYFLHDLLVVLARLQTEGAPMLVHACCCLFVYTYAVFSFYLTFYGAGFLLWELSTPLVHARWALAKTGREGSRAYAANGLLMAAVFFCCRPLWGTWLSYKFFSDTASELAAPKGGFPPSGIWGYRVANVALNGLNYFWFYKIASKAARLLTGGARGLKKEAQGGGKKQE